MLLVGGFFRSLQFTSINTLAYAEIEPPLMSRATSMVAAAQQISISTGVAVGALVVEFTLRLKHGAAMSAADFPPAFLIVGAPVRRTQVKQLELRCLRRNSRRHGRLLGGGWPRWR